MTPETSTSKMQDDASGNPSASSNRGRRWTRAAAITVSALLLLLMAVVLSIVSGACSLFLPERFAVNAPIRHMLFGTGGAAPSSEETERLRVAGDHYVALFASGLPNVRFLRFTSSGDLLASLPRSGRIVRVQPDRDGDGQSDGMADVLSGLDRPHGLDLHDGWLYVAENSQVIRVRYDAKTGTTSGAQETIASGLPAGGNHWTRTVRMGPDGFLYVSVGSSCNACEEKDPRRAAILRYPANGGEGKIYASGLRNAVGFDWQPGTQALYATDNGRDLLGDDFPPCELNQIEADGFYGWPYVNGFGVSDPDFGAVSPAKQRSARDPAHGFGAHNAPLGITFVRHPNAPAWLRGAALVALHGSWNRTRKDGYKVVSLHWDPSGRIEERDFLTGFELDEDVIGRPVDVAEGPDGAFYVSDDYAGVIYRVARGSGASIDPGAPAARRMAPDAGRALEGMPADEIAERSARGSRLWETHECATCHEAANAGAGVVPVPLGTLSQRYRVDDLVRFLAAPTPPMPTPPLDESERRDLAVHLLAR